MTYDTLGYFDWAGIDLNAAGIRVRELDGVNSMPPLRGGEDVIVGDRPGRFPVDGVDDARRLMLGCYLLPTAGGSRAPIWANVESILKSSSDRKLHTLLHHHPLGDRSAQARLVDFRLSDLTSVNQVFLGVLDLWLPDPYFYAADVVTGPTAIPASPTVQAVTHPGTSPAYRVSFDIEGPISNPRITNLANGFYVECLVTVAAGEHLLVDCWNATALNNAVNAIASIKHSGGKLWMKIDPGVNNLSVSGTGVSGATKLTSTFEPPFI